MTVRRLIVGVVFLIAALTAARYLSDGTVETVTYKTNGLLIHAVDGQDLRETLVCVVPDTEKMNRIRVNAKVKCQWHTLE